MSVTEDKKSIQGIALRLQCVLVCVCVHSVALSSSHFHLPLLTLINWPSVTHSV